MSASTGGTPPAGRAALVANLAVVYVVFGSTYLAIRIMVETIPPLLGAGLRFLVAGLLVLGWCTVRDRRLPRLPPRELAGTALVGLLVIGGGLGLLTLGEETTPSGLASLLIASVPAWVVLLRLVHRERVGPLTLVGVLVGLAGVALLGGLGAAGLATVAGVVVLLVAAACEAVGSYYTPRLALPQDPALSSGVQMLITGPVLLVAALAAGEPVAPAGWSGASLLGLVYLIGPGSILAYGSFVWLVSRAPASIATTYTYVNPAVALLLGWLVLDETITWGVLAGALLVVLGVAAVLGGERGGTEDRGEEDRGTEDRGTEARAAARPPAAGEDERDGVGARRDRR